MKVKLLIILFTIPQLLIGQIPELKHHKIYQDKVKGNVPKSKVYRLVICTKDSIFPDSLLEYTNIIDLHVKSCTNFIGYENGLLTSIPEDICKLKNLISLKLQGHRIKKLPDCISNLNLKYLNLKFNADISIDNLNFNDSLLYLNLDYCWLNSIPESITKFKGLRWLMLEDNKIEYIPENIDKLKNLNSLFLSGNPLQEYSAIFTIENLASLSLANCNLKNIPATVSNLANLEYLYIENNNLDSIPSTISNLTKLKTLNIRNNNIRKKELRKLKKVLPDCEILY